MEPLAEAKSGGVGLRSGEFEHPWIGRRIAFRDPKRLREPFSVAT